MDGCEVDESSGLDTLNRCVVIDDSRQMALQTGLNWWLLGEGACFGRAHPRAARGLGPPGETCLHPSSSFQRDLLPDAPP